MFLTCEVGFDHRVRVLHSNWGGQRLDDIYYRFKVQTQTRCELNVLNGNQIKIKGAPTPSGPSTILYGRVLSTRVDTRPELIYNRLLKLEFDSKVKRHNPLTRNALFVWLRDFKELRVAQLLWSSKAQRYFVVILT